MLEEGSFCDPFVHSMDCGFVSVCANNVLVEFCVLLIQAATIHLFVTFISHLETMNAVAYKQLLWSAKARIYTRKNFLQK